jgi:hypothetical protein
MSTSDEIFVAGGGSLEAIAGWLSELLCLEPVEDPGLATNEYLLRGKSSTGKGKLTLLLEPNTYGEADPAPEDVSAIDRSEGVVDVTLGRVKGAEARTAEARAVFDRIVATRPDVSLILSRALSWMVAAYRPGIGVHTFPPETSLDADDIDVWREWVRG